jgi:hypothetical protein
MVHGSTSCLRPRLPGADRNGKTSEYMLARNLGNRAVHIRAQSGVSRDLLLLDRLIASHADPST